MSFYKTRYIVFTVLLIVGYTFAQAHPVEKDSLISGEDLSGVVVTATRSDRKMADVPMPVDIIGKEQIESSGSSRLDEILSEQTGLSIVKNHGFGVQMQGMDPEYTLILVDGEPVIGRTAGTLDLTRISLTNIERIEILKGPSSSLYGSDALAGVINIITKKGVNNELRIRSKYETNQTLDNTVSGTLGWNDKGALSLSANYYRTNGYDLNPKTYGNTVNPYKDYTFRGNFHYQLTPKLKVDLNGHYFSQIQKNNELINAVRDSIVIKGEGKEKDLRIAPVFSYKFSPDWKLKLRSYWSGYKSESFLNDFKADTAYESTYFHQNLWKEELQSEQVLNQHQVLTLGVGYEKQYLSASRYEEKKEMSDFYLYGQHEWHPTASWNILTGLRFDNPSNYQARLSPKVAAQYQLNSRWKVRASVGMGYKAPDFRQLYIDFVNNVQGYTVLGSKVMGSTLERMKAAGQIAQVSLPENVDLAPESSVAYNLGATYQAPSGWEAGANVFRNDIKNLIDTRVIAITSAGLPLFGYHNVRRVFTEGTEINVSVPLFDHKLRLSAGYQFLIARDKDVVDSIKAGKVGKWVWEDGVKKDKNLRLSDYGGLFNRSKNTFNVKAYYRNKSWSFNVRLIYRGKAGFMDQNGNLILDTKEEYTPGYLLTHLDVAKRFWEDRIKLEAGVKDLFDYKDPQHLPHIAGRRFYMSATFHIF